MEVTKDNLASRPGPSDWFTGSVFIDTVAAPSERSRIGAASVHFAPGARTAWHTHPHGQTIWVIEGVGLCQCEGGPIEVIRRRSCVLRAKREPLARRGTQPPDDAPRDPAGRRERQLRQLG